MLTLCALLFPPLSVLQTTLANTHRIPECQRPTVAFPYYQ